MLVKQATVENSNSDVQSVDTVESRNELMQLSEEHQRQIYKPAAFEKYAPILIYEGPVKPNYDLPRKEWIGGKPFTENELALKVMYLVQREIRQQERDYMADIEQQKKS